MDLVRLGDVCRFQNGRAFKKSEWTEEGLPIIRIQNLNRLSAPFNYFSGEYDRRIEVSDGDLLFSWSGTVGSSFGPHIWSRGKGVLNQHIFRVSVDDSVDKKYAYYALLAITGQIEKNVSGAVGLVHVTQSRLKEFTIPLPNLAEQKRIVTILDEVFAGIATAVTNTEKNLANARELFESYLNHMFSRLPPGTNQQSLSALCGSATITYGVIKLGGEWPNGVPCLRTSNVRRLRIDTRGIKRIEPGLSKKYSRTILKGGEVLVNVRGTLGGVAVAAADMSGWNVSREVAVVPSDPSKVLPEFAAYSIATRASQDWLVDVQKGVAYTGINLTDLRELKIPIPSMDHQRRYVAKLDEMVSNCDAIELRLRQKLSSLDELKKSLLQKTFSGELTAVPEDEIEDALA